MSSEGEASGVVPLTRADIPKLVKAVMAEMRKPAGDPSPSKSLSDTTARAQSSRDDLRAHTIYRR